VNDLLKLLDVATEAIALARDVTRARPPGMVFAKGDRDMTSETDLAVEDAVREFLIARTPEIGFLGEEAGVAGGRAQNLLWVLDPIDGTANFVHGIPLYAISLGLVSGDTPLVGVVDMPALGRTYSGARDLGATCNGVRIRGGPRRNLGDAIIAIGDYAVGDDSTRKNVIRLALTEALCANVQRVRMLGTAATDLVFVADGSLDGSVMFSNKPWDTSAGVLIAREAGISVLDVDGSPYTLNSKGTVAVAATLAEELMTLILGVTRR
jgi:myo-inositol-1(or 4)-monophosphatase